MVQDDEAVGLEGLRVCFDDERVVSDAGVMLVASLAQRLGLEALAGDLVRLRCERPGAANAGRKIMALRFAMVLGAESFDDCDVLRAGRTRRLLGGWMPAPSTLGTFLRAFTFGHVRQLDKLLRQALERAWRAGPGPGDGRLVIDVDSFVGVVCGRLKQGAAYGDTRIFGYHPNFATRADTRETLHIRLRKGSANSQKGMLRFLRRADRAHQPGRRDRQRAAARRLGVLERGESPRGTGARAWRSSFASARGAQSQTRSLGRSDDEASRASTRIGRLTRPWKEGVARRAA